MRYDIMKICMSAVRVCTAAAFLIVVGLEASHAGNDMPAEVNRFRSIVRSRDVATYSAAAAGLRRWMMANDPHYPLYHFVAPEGWINDPNGVIYHKGQYHLFYQYDPIVDGKRSARTWGHAVSTDLVHWQDWPVAIWPDTKYDRNGVWSGNMVIDEQGIPTALYTGGVNGRAETYGMLARSRDGMVTWEKKMVMDQPPYPGTPVHWDAQVWKEGDTWFQLIGGTKDGKGAALLWTSPDLEHWRYRKPIFCGPPGEFWELPYLLPFGQRFALLIGVGGNPYWIGSYDRKAMEFKPDTAAHPRFADYGTYYSFNPNMVDDKGPNGSPRRIMHGWVTGPKTPTRTVPYWEGAHSIPRVITVEGDRLLQTPIPELSVLRGTHQRLTDLTVKPGWTGYLKDIAGDALEIVARFEPAGANVTRFGLKTRVSGDGRQATPVWFEPASRKFGAADRGGPSDLPGGQPVTLHVFVDRSIVEVYLNGNACTARMFPDPQSLGLDLFADGGEVKVSSLEIWEMRTMWEGP